MGNSNSWGYVLGDLDGDGDINTVVDNRTPIKFDSTGTMTNKIWLNNGKGFFTESNQKLGTGRGIQLIDLDYDGNLDLPEEPDEFRDRPLHIYKNDGNNDIFPGNYHAHLIKGVICGYRIEEIENPITKQGRYLVQRR